MIAEWLGDGPSVWEEMAIQLYNTDSLPAAFMCQHQSKLHQISKSWLDWPVPAHRTCMSKHVRHTCTQYLMHAPHTSTTDYVILSSPHFIRLRLWCGIPWSLRNTVLGNETEWICTLAPRKRLPIDPPCVSCSLSFSFFLFPSIILSITSPNLQHLSVLLPTYIITIFSHQPRWMSLFL